MDHPAVVMHLEAAMPSAVTVRPYRASDAKALHEAVRESLKELMPWLPWCRPDYSRADSEAWIRETAAGRESGSLYAFVIVADGRFAGGCGISRVNRDDNVGNLGYWVRTSLTGQGIAATAAQQVIAWTFAYTSLNRLEIVVARDNLRSQRVAEKTGALRDGLLRKRLMVEGRAVDAVLYSVIRPD